MNDAIPVESDVVLDALTKINTVGRDLSSGSFREKITAIEQAMVTIPGILSGDIPQCPLTHFFANGICVRSMFLPGGSLYTGRIHKKDHPFFILHGDLTVVSEFTGVQRIMGPYFSISKAGTKRMGFAHEDTVLVTIHRTDEVDPEKITDEITVGTYEEFERLSK